MPSAPFEVDCGGHPSVLGAAPSAAREEGLALPQLRPLLHVSQAGFRPNSVDAGEHQDPTVLEG
eukprot:14100150-Alexandrium_andersonii.AAC.1